jgi:hypothetical protein
MLFKQKPETKRTSHSITQVFYNLVWCSNLAPWPDGNLHQLSHYRPGGKFTCCNVTQNADAFTRFVLWPRKTNACTVLTNFYQINCNKVTKKNLYLSHSLQQFVVWTRVGSKFESHTVFCHQGMWFMWTVLHHVIDKHTKHHASKCYCKWDVHQLFGVAYKITAEF